MSSSNRPSEALMHDIALVDLLDRLLGEGVVIVGDITLSVADVDLVRVSLRALIASEATAERAGLAPLEEVT